MQSSQGWKQDFLRFIMFLLDPRPSGLQERMAVFSRLWWHQHPGKTASLGTDVTLGPPRQKEPIALAMGGPEPVMTRLVRAQLHFHSYPTYNYPWTSERGVKDALRLLGSFGCRCMCVQSAVPESGLDIR